MIKLKKVNPNIINSSVLSWYEDIDVVRFSDNQYRIFSLESQQTFIKNIQNDKNIYFRGIYYNNEYIGNVQLNDINSVHKKAEITYLIGNKKYWGKGIATEVIKNIIRISAQELNLNKLYAGVADKNLSSIKLLEKLNFEREGIKQKHLLYNGIWYDQIDYGLLLR